MSDTDHATLDPAPESFQTSDCTICTHPDAAAIDEALLGGTAIRSVAGTHGLSRSSVHRHRQNHLSVQAITEPDPDVQRPALRLVDVHGQLTTLCDRLEKVVELSTRTRKPAAAVQAMRELRQSLEAIAKLQADPALARAAVLAQLQQLVDEGVADWMVALIDFLANTAGLDVHAGLWGSVVAECLRSTVGDTPGYRRPNFSKVDTSAVAADLERQALDATGRMEAEVTRRVEAELRRREAQSRPAIEARTSLAIEGGPSWSL